MMDKNFYVVVMRAASNSKELLDHYTFADNEDEAVEKAGRKWMAPELVSVELVTEKEMEKLVIVTSFRKMNRGW